MTDIPCELRLSAEDYIQLKRLAEQWIEEYRPLSPYTHSNEFLNAVITYCRKLPTTIQDCLFEMQKDRREILLLKKLPNDEVLPKTPLVENAAIVKPSYLAEFWISVVGSWLGEIYGYTLEFDKLFQNLFPTKKAEKIYSGHSSKKPLQPHTDNCHVASANSGAQTPDYIQLYTSKDDPNHAAATPYIALSEVLVHLTSREKKILFEKKFRPEMLHAFGGKGDILKKPIAILYGDFNNPYVQYNPLLKPLTQEASDAKDTFEKIADRLKHQIHLEAGSLLVINNKKVLHSRSVFPVNFDGDDRWVVRSYISKNLGPVADDICNGGRIVKPRF